MYLVDPLVIVSIIVAMSLLRPSGHRHADSPIPSAPAALINRATGTTTVDVLETMKSIRRYMTMKIKETFLTGSIGIAAALSGAAQTHAQHQPVKNIVLVHGAFADGSSWSKVIRILEARGFHVAAVQNPLTSLKEDVNATHRIIALQDGPVILVGHSWGGAVITEAGDDPKVAGLVYVAAYVPDAGTSANDNSGPYGVTPGQKAIQVDSQLFARMSEEGILNHFAQGLSPDERQLVWAVQGQTYGPIFDEKLTHAAWKTKPSWHVVSMDDQTLSPEMEESDAVKAGGRAIKLHTCHVAMLQEPDKVADVIAEAANDALKP
jgi:pimeloyl-ACP methyl ester carboxylesterase